MRFFKAGPERNSSTYTRTTGFSKCFSLSKRLILTLTFSSFQPEADFRRNSYSFLSCITGDDQIQGESDDMHKFIHRRLMPSLLGFFFRFFYSGRFRFYGSFFVFFKLFEEVLFYLFLYRLSFIQVGCRYSSLFLSYLYLVSYNLSFTRIDCLYSSFFFLFFICFHIIFPLFNEAVFIHLFSFSFLFSFSLSFIHIGCLYSSLFFSFFIYFHLVFPLFK